MFIVTEYAALSIKQITLSDFRMNVSINGSYNIYEKVIKVSTQTCL